MRFLIKMILIVFIFTILIFIFVQKNEKLEEKPCVNRIENNSLDKVENENKKDQMVYKYSLNNADNLNLEVVFKLYEDGIIKEKYSKSKQLIDKNQEINFGLSTARDLKFKNNIEFALEIDDYILFFESIDVYTIFNEYYIETNDSIYPNVGIEYPILTFYTGSKSNNIEINKYSPEKEPQKYKQFLIDNYKYVYFLEFVISELE